MRPRLQEGTPGVGLRERRPLGTRVAPNSRKGKGPGEEGWWEEVAVGWCGLQTAGSFLNVARLVWRRSGTCPSGAQGEAKERNDAWLPESTPLCHPAAPSFASSFARRDAHSQRDLSF